MKPSTQIWSRFESKGYPELTQQQFGTVKETMTQLLLWVLKSTMNKRILITFATSEAGLMTQRESKRENDIAELQAIFDDLESQIDDAQEVV